MPFSARAFGATDVGRKRQGNEDALLIDEEHDLFLVADGMGGHSAGEVASSRAVEVVASVFGRRWEELQRLRDEPTAESGFQARELMQEAIDEACRAVFKLSRKLAMRSGMGTTFTGIFILGSRALVANVGDSRTYLLRAGELHRLTEDHTLVQTQVRAGLLAEADIEKSPFRNVITRAVGIHDQVFVDTLLVELRVGDRFLLCSDGLHGLVDEPQLASCLGGPDLSAIPRELIARANAAGGRDNITAVVVELAARGEPDSSEKIDLDAALSALAPFGDLGLRDRAVVLGAADRLSMADGQRLPRDAGWDEALGLLLSGRLVVEELGGTERVLETGGWFGLSGLVAQEAAFESIEAEGPVRLLRLRRRSLMRALGSEPMLALRVLRAFEQASLDS